jgi:DNA modification methylase
LVDKKSNMKRERKTATVAQQRQYGVLDVEQAKQIAGRHLSTIALDKVTSFGLPEIDDRYHVWRVPILSSSDERVGEVVIDARTSLIDASKTTSMSKIESRLLKRQEQKEAQKEQSSGVPGGNHHNLRNVIALGEATDVLADLPPQSTDLIFTSPPYFNARVEYRDYDAYADYLDSMRKVIRACHRVLAEGRFFVMNVAPVLVRRASRSQASRRIAVPFDMHTLFTSEGYEFIDDIIWIKPEGAGWATGRGRRFAADRNPLQYKAVPITEYILVYRKQTPKLIDWNIRNHPRPEDVATSKIGDGYDASNVWRIKPRHTRKHPAVFPLELAERVVRYYSFVGDVVLDPFAGIGTTGHAAAKLDRNFVMIEAQEQYVETMVEESRSWADLRDNDMLFINCEPTTRRLF